MGLDALSPSFSHFSPGPQVHARARTHTHAGTSHPAGWVCKRLEGIWGREQRFLERTFFGPHRDLIVKPGQ